MIVLDRAFPTLIRMYGVGLFPWPDAENAKEIYRRYGYVSFPRTLFLFISCLSVSMDQFFRVDQTFELVILVVSLILWGIFALFDLLKARK